MNTRDPQALIEKLKSLSPERVAEVEDFVDFLRAREEARNALKREAGRKLLELGKAMQSAGAPVMSEEEIQAEVDAVRAVRRVKRDAPGA